MFVGFLRVVHDDERIQEFNIIYGQKLCSKCDKKTKELISYESSQPSDMEVDESSDPTITLFDETLNESLKKLDQTISPMKSNFHTTENAVKYGKRKIRKVSEIFNVKVAEHLEVPSELLLTESPEKEDCRKCEDFDKMIEELKDKCAISTKKEKIQILTLAPSSWSIENTADQFNVSQYMVRKAKELKKSDGILSVPLPSKGGRTLSENHIAAVQRFYEDDQYSRMCPGKKEFVSVYIDGKKEHKQKRLLLINLNELHIQFREKYPNIQVGLSKFCELRPKWCVPVGDKSSHSVCVCEIHQNCKLVLSSLPGQSLHYKDLLGKAVCDLSSRNCMLRCCENCPGLSVLKTFLEDMFTPDVTDFDSLVKYKQWVKNESGKTSLVTLESSVSDFIDKVCSLYEGLLPHQFIAKSQAVYLTELKESLCEDTAIILLDFAENYSFVVQDAVQGHHWDNSQATLHPLVCYAKTGEDLKVLNICVISDCMSHDTNTVHAFLKPSLLFVMENFPNVKKIVYFSDGAASQYKNFKNFINLCKHEADFGVPAQWNFFATSHGKSPCDGIGGTVKRLVARASLQAVSSGQILTPLDMFHWADRNISGIKFIYMTDEEVLQHCDDFNLPERYSAVKTIAGTRSHHAFIPKSETELELKRISYDTDGKTVKLGSVSARGDRAQVSFERLQPGYFVACGYDTHWFVGCIEERSDTEHDIKVNFMKREVGVTLTWPTRKDICWIPIQDVICLISVPARSSGRQYSLSETDLTKILDILNA